MNTADTPNASQTPLGAIALREIGAPSIGFCNPDALPRQGAALDGAIQRARSCADRGWEPGFCDRCKEPIAGWNAPAPFAIAHRCADCSYGAKAREWTARRDKALLLAPAWESIPEALRALTLSSIAPRITYKAGIEAATAFGLARRPAPPTMLIVGQSGSGKTSLAVATLADRLRRAGELEAPPSEAHAASTARFFFAPDLGRARERSRLGAEAPAIVEAFDASFLVLDEFGAEAARHSEIIEEIIFARAAHGRATMIATNLSSAQIAGRYSAGMLRRIASDDHCSRVVRVGPTPTTSRAA